MNAVKKQNQMLWTSEQVEDMLKVLQTSPDKSVVYNCLVKLRTDLVKESSDGIVLFRMAGGVPIMVRLLGKVKNKILEEVLSILGNCFTDELACIEAGEWKVLDPLVTILKTIPNPVIQGLACCLLGNMAKSHKASQFLNAHYAAIAPAICHIIESTSTVQTRIMVFRACRFLLVSSQFLKYFLMANGLLQMMLIFDAVIKNNEAPKENSQKYFKEVARNLEPEAIELVHEILKCLVLLSAKIGMKSWELVYRNIFPAFRLQVKNKSNL